MEVDGKSQELIGDGMPITKGIGAYHDKEGLGVCFAGGLAESGNGNDLQTEP